MFCCRQLADGSFFASSRQRTQGHWSPVVFARRSLQNWCRKRCRRVLAPTDVTQWHFWSNLFFHCHCFSGRFPCGHNLASYLSLPSSTCSTGEPVEISGRGFFMGQILFSQSRRTSARALKETQSIDRQLMAWPRPFFVCCQIPEGRGVAIMPALWWQYRKSVLFLYFKILLILHE